MESLRYTLRETRQGSWFIFDHETDLPTEHVPMEYMEADMRRSTLEYSHRVATGSKEA